MTEKTKFPSGENPSRKRTRFVKIGKTATRGSGDSDLQPASDARVDTLKGVAESKFAPDSEQGQIVHRMFADLRKDKDGLDSDVKIAPIKDSGVDVSGLWARAHIRFNDLDETHMEVIAGVTESLCERKMSYDDLFYLMEMDDTTEHEPTARALTYKDTANGRRVFTERLQEIDRFQKPRVLEAQSGAKSLYLPTNQPGVVLEVGGLGLTHPGNHENDPMSFGILMLPDELLGQNLGAELEATQIQ